MKSFEQLKNYCLQKAGAFEDYPFDDTTWTAKVGGKMFALITRDSEPMRLNLKCEPDYALALRDAHPAIIPGYHMNKRHWNSLILDGSLDEKLTKELVDLSYELVFKSLTKAKRTEIIGVVKQRSGDLPV